MYAQKKGKKTRLQKKPRVTDGNPSDKTIKNKQNFIAPISKFPGGGRSVSHQPYTPAHNTRCMYSARTFRTADRSYHSLWQDRYGTVGTNTYKQTIQEIQLR